MLIIDAKINKNFDMISLSKQKRGKMHQLATLPSQKPANVCRCEAYFTPCLETTRA